MYRQLSLKRLASLSLILLCGASASLNATTLLRLNLEQLARAADAVALVRCTDTAAYVEQGTVWTHTRFTLIESLKGTPPSRIVVHLPGGRAGHTVVSIEAVPRFQTGEEGVLFLERLPAGDYSVTGWALGSFRIHRSDHTGQQTVTQDSSALPVFDPASRRFITEGIREMPLGEFRRRLATAIHGGPAPQ